ncbi:MAG: TIGR01777 family oxidoreductase [Salibacteraceae bacterium]
MATVLVTGGTGLVGRHLCKHLKNAGYDVAILSQVRYNKSEFPVYYWNWKEKEIDEVALRNSDFIIHLAGANIAGQRWTPERKKLVIDSRVKSSEFLHQKIKELNLSPTAFISASAVGYYGMVTSNNIFKESDSPSTDFLGETCKKWEQAASNVYDPRIRVALIRTGIVLTKNDGALAKMLQPVKLGAASALGSGKQYMPWIHVDDLCEIYLKAIQDPKMFGAYNASAPEHHTNSTFTKAIAKPLGRKMWLPNVPSFVLKLMLGEMANMLLFGSRVSSKKLVDRGFKFKFASLEKALDDLM